MVNMASITAQGGTEVLSVKGETEVFESSTAGEAVIKTTVESSDGTISQSREDTIPLTPYASKELSLTFSLSGIENDKNINACMEVIETSSSTY